MVIEDQDRSPGLYNHPEFATDYKNARFFIVKSFSEDNVHRSIKYNVWASTPHGNKKLDTAYHRDAEKICGKCPIFLFFSVNASGQFCGVAEMVGPVDFEKDAAYWQQGKWNGQFPLKWHIVKDVPNNRFSHILLQNNDNKPVTHSRDSQEVKLHQGIEMLRIFKEYEAHTSILDDFDYYDERESQKVGEDGGRKEETSCVEQLSERSYQSPSSIASYYGADNPVRLASDIGKRREKEYSSVPTTSDLYGNRGPRSFTRVKSKNSSGLSSSAGDATNDSSTAGSNPSLYNHPEFATDYKNARFFIVKSFSEDNVHRSIKYNVWASTPHGSKKLDTAYRDAEKMCGKCPIFLFFSVNASGQFCGVAEMVGPVDFEKDAAYWQQGKWNGQFPVKWHIVKDVPNNRFSHILLQNNDNKPVTHSRDSQEVKLRQGIEMLRISKEYEAHTSILDDFSYYDERENEKVGEDGVRKEETSAVEQLSERLQAVSVEDGKEWEKEDLKEKT
ncbi:hypothetical protein F2Q70_00007855 [Brassica cretica]|uniref:YTH domain-containing family protein n=1 Tax=Brassica cretica TaxID=69181 RepID=A0A8S9M6C5_BRACR|nr:hypothetical protein F2Q70_00007855 [Brassica cretica]